MKNIIIKENENITLLNCLGDGGSRFDYTLERNAELVLALVSCGNINGEFYINIKLTQDGARARLLGIVLGNNTGQCVLHTLQDHQAKNTTSDLLVKSVLSDESSFVFDGKIRVTALAQQTDAYQRNENLLLSEKVHVESEPTLEILANDVRCTHAVTSANIPPDQLWYLESRGVSDKEAKKLIVSGFIESTIAKISDTIIQKRVRQKLWPVT